MAPKTTLWAVFVFSLAKCVSSSPTVILPTEWPEVELGSGMLQTGTVRPHSLNTKRAAFTGE